MARPRRISAALVAQAKLLAAQTQEVQELRMAQAILLPALAQMTLAQTATVLGLGRATVVRLQRRFGRRNDPAQPQCRPWGGRRRALMSWTEEESFLAGWQATAERGEIVALTPLRAALAKRLGRQVKPSVVYRLLKRHQWRKVAPDTRHPKAALSEQAKGKNAGRQRTWRPC